jgi:hypothetical protein
MDRLNRTGAQRPLFVAYSQDGGQPFSGSYASIRAHVIDELNAIYYTGGATSQTRSARWGIRVYWLNGNENSDKGMLGTNNATNLALWMDSQRALYDACHYIDPTTGQRRFPDAYAGSNPTQEHERSGIVAWWLEPSARYHDIVVWSMYPPGRGVNDPVLAVDPRFDWPTFDQATRNNRQQGYLTRCFYRTSQAQARARADTGENRVLAIGTGEIGIASDPDDHTQRPYYAVRALMFGIYTLGQQYQLPVDFVCWWDQKTAATAPHNVLTDEPPNSDHGGNNAVTTNPSTATAFRNWRDYEPRVGGSLPTQWANNPKSTWNTTGPVV